jgi:peptide/nickel transport system substrate-binding protein
MPEMTANPVRQQRRHPKCPVPVLSRLAVAALGSFADAGPAACGARLRIGLASEASSADPHFHNLGPNNQLRRNVFESLVDNDEAQQLGPLLAESWEPIDETRWQFNLRKDVKFSDGSTFDAYDVIYTVCRIPGVPDSPSLLTTYTKAITDFEVPDPHTLIVHTAAALSPFANRVLDLRDHFGQGQRGRRCRHRVQPRGLR